MSKTIIRRWNMTEQEALRILLLMAGDWLETIDPSYAEESLELDVQGGQAQEALSIATQLRSRLLAGQLNPEGQYYF
jgi:hypothetical protein